MSFIYDHGKATGKKAFLYEAQVSGVVSGLDEWRWTAYCFADTYFSSLNEDGETVVDYHQDTQMDDMSPDPLICGEKDANTPVWSPKDYFLLLLGARLSKVRCEWEEVLTKLEEATRAYKVVCLDLPAQYFPHLVLPHDSGHASAPPDDRESSKCFTDG